jgi:AhpD family alkylhydroperoxidase
LPGSREVEVGRYKEQQRDLVEMGKQLRAHIPDAYSGFAALHKGAMSEGVLSLKEKELIALAVSTALQCDGCIASHARAAARQGATATEAAEAIGVALLLMGGPGTVYGPQAFAAFREFSGETE